MNNLSMFAHHFERKYGIKLWQSPDDPYVILCKKPDDEKIYEFDALSAWPSVFSKLKDLLGIK